MKSTLLSPVRSVLAASAFAFLPVALIGCGDDGNSGTEADRIGVGAECQGDADCLAPQKCLKQFKGGYCGIADCASDADCPQGSACVAHSDGHNYCFRICADKVECNANRSPDLESNCSSSVTFVDPKAKGKACIPPTG